MEDKLDLQERTPEPQKPAEANAPRRLTPPEALKTYGIRTAVLGALMLWFGYDGWYNPNIESKGFNKVGAVILAIFFLFYGVMTLSAALAVRRQRQQSGPPQT